MANAPGVPIVSAFDVTTSFTQMYLSPTGVSRTIIDSVTFNNYSNNTVTLSVRIVQNGGTSDELSEIITTREIRGGGSYLAPELLGQAIGQGGVIEVKASVASSINATLTATTVQ